ncbi:Gfo/Idh/MocA family protein [Candidatus Omnitrophota bacterium]
MKSNSAVVVTAGATLAAESAMAVDTAPKKIRIGIVGGRFGCSFQWHEHPDCTVEAVSDLNPVRRENLMKTYGCTRSYNSLEELVHDKNIDAVGVFTDAPLHVQHAVWAMKHDKHVISAVPACSGSIEDAELLLDTVKTTGLTYMMAETSYYQQQTISARKFYEKNLFGELYYCESEYQHAGMTSLYHRDGKRTWRHGYAPMHYPTHCTAHLIGVTGERLIEVVSHGWGDDHSSLKDNIYGNPFWNEMVMFKTDRGHAFRVNRWKEGAHRGCERAQWIGSKMSFYSRHPNGIGPVIIRTEDRMEKDDAGFERMAPKFEKYELKEWWRTDTLPEPLRHNSGHEGSHTFLTHEFIDALTHNRQPTVNVYEAIAYTVPGIIAHESAKQGGALMKIPQYDPKR